MKSIMLSIQPKFYELIANGKKTVEVRKTKPKAETPFKCYIYCTKSNIDICPKKILRKADDADFQHIMNGKVVGEFICEEISKFSAEFTNEETYEDIRFHYLGEHGEEELIVVSNEWENPDNSWICRESCLSFDDFRNYIGVNFHDVPFYGWHISDLVIYDKPKGLEEFNHPCIHEPDCVDCKYSINEARFCYDESVGCDRRFRRPPQSWCYVEELGGERHDQL